MVLNVIKMLKSKDWGFVPGNNDIKHFTKKQEMLGKTLKL